MVNGAPIATARFLYARYSLGTRVPRHHFKRAPSPNSTKALTWCANIFVGCSVTPSLFFGRSLPFLILSIVLKNNKNLYVGSLWNFWRLSEYE